MNSQVQIWTSLNQWWWEEEVEGGNLCAPYQTPSMLRSVSGLCSFRWREISTLSYLFLPFSLLFVIPLCLCLPLLPGLSLLRLFNSLPRFNLFEKSVTGWALCQKQCSFGQSGALQFGKFPVWYSSLAKATKFTRGRMHHLCKSYVRYSAERFRHNHWGKRVVPGWTHCS